MNIPSHDSRGLGDAIPQPSDRIHNWEWVCSGLPAVIRDPRVRLPILIVLHLMLFSAIYAFAFFARFNFQSDADRETLFLGTLLPVVAIKITVFYMGGHFHGWWRYVTFGDLRSLLKVSLLSMILVAFVDYFALPLKSQIPRLSILLDMAMTVLAIGGLRSTWRFADELLGTTFHSHKKRPAFLIGTDHRIGQLASQINSTASMPCRVTGYLATGNGYRRKAVLGGIPVLGHVDSILDLARHAKVEDILVPAGSIEGAAIRQLIRVCNDSGLNVRVLPRFEDAMEGTENIPLRPLNIVDLLRRDAVKLDTVEVANFIRGQRVLVTGAGGSIGSEICRQVIRFRPAELVLLGRGENRIHAIWNDLRDLADQFDIQLSIEIGNITDRSQMERLFSRTQPEIVFHAAAHKHVPLMELHPGEAVKNNIMGTEIIASLAKQCGVGHFVMVSTDKAVNPTSVMGCSKHLAECVIQDFAQSGDTKFAVVRFGNVLGSAGSVIPLFQEQIKRGGPITVTDPRMTRYFMSIPEASQLVIQAASQCVGGEIFVLDMGKPVRIVDLARDLITLSGLPEDSIEISFTGIRAGEKLYEELYFDEETTIATSHPKVRAANPRAFDDGPSLSEITQLYEFISIDDEQIMRRLKQLVTCYQSGNDLSPESMRESVAASGSNKTLP